MKVADDSYFFSDLVRAEISLHTCDGCEGRLDHSLWLLDEGGSPEQDRSLLCRTVGIQGSDGRKCQ